MSMISRSSHVRPGRGSTWIPVARRIALIVFCALASMQACAAGRPVDGEVKVGTVGIEARVHNYQIDLVFSESMAVLRNQVVEGIAIQPRQPFECTWTSDTELSCGVDLERPLPAATRYTIDIAPGLHTVTGLPLGAVRLAAESDRPGLSAYVTEWKAGVPQLRVVGDTPMTADAIVRVLELRVGDRVWRDLKLTPLVVEREAWEREQPEFLVALPDDLPADAVVEVHARRGLASTDGPLRSERDKRLLSFRHREPFRVRGIACEGRKGTGEDVRADGVLTLDCLADETLRLRLSAAPDVPSLRALLARLPAGMPVPTLSSGGGDPRRDAPVIAPGRALELRLGMPGDTLAFDLPEELVDTDGRRIAAPRRIEVRIGDPKPVLHVPAAQMLVASPDVAWLESVNAPSVRIDTVGVADAVIRETVTVPATRGTRQAFGARAARRALATGGWSAWTLSGGSHGIEAAAPQFDLHAQIWRGTVIAWAVDWKDSRPVTDAEVRLTLLGDDGVTREIVRGRTDRQGLVRLALPADTVLPASGVGRTVSREARWLLHARSGTRRAILPLGVPGQYPVSDLGDRKPLDRLFLVADRPLYRAGDVLRYRGWLRDWSDATPRLTSTREVSLELVSDYTGDVIRTWTVAPDADGTVSGEFVLPSQMVDGDYCIRIAESHENGLCVFVGTFRAQDLWVDAKAATSLLRPGDPLEVTVSAGYWSGGGASGASLDDLTVAVADASPAEAYPRYAAYAFLDDTADSASTRRIVSRGEMRADYALRQELRPKRALDADGRLQATVPLDFVPDDPKRPLRPTFGRVDVVAEVALPGRESAASPVVTAWYADHARYVGLRVPGYDFATVAPLRLEGVVIDAAGQTQSDARITVTVEYLPIRDMAQVADDGRPVEPVPEPIATCTLVAGIEAACDVPRTRVGRYRFTARSGDAVIAVVERRIWWLGGGRDTVRGIEPALEPALEIVEAPAAPGAPVRLRLRQPYAKADALVVTSAGDRVLDARVIAVDGIDTLITLPIDAGGCNYVDLHVRVREHAPSQVETNGFRVPPRVVALDQRVEVPRPSRDAAIVLTATPERTAPATSVRLRLENRGTTPRTVTLAVFDDALRALAGTRWEAFDPQGEMWLGWRPSRWRSQPASVGYHDWNRGGWSLPRSWDDDPRAPGLDASTLPDVPSSRLPQTGSATGNGVAAPVLRLDRARLWRQPASGLSTVGDVLFDISASDGGALQGWMDNGDAGDDIDEISVTGSRIATTAELGIGDAVAIGRVDRLPARRTDDLLAPSSAMRDIRLRSNFAQTVLWEPMLPLAPGETREIALPLPDNLTTWRAVAWTADAGDGFDRVEATIEAGQPVEVRLQTPTRIYPGDRAELTANVRQSGDAPAVFDARLRVDALDAAATRDVPLPANGQATWSLTIAPDDAVAPGALAATATAQGAPGADGVLQSIALASPRIDTRLSQTGWLGDAPLTLPLPLPVHGAHDGVLRVSLLPGAEAWMQGWTEDLHRYPHRCWEQMLSRAVAAAIALERGDEAHFPDARAAIREAIDNVRVFQGELGDFRYFADEARTDVNMEDRHVPLTAYSLRALRLLRQLGHAVPEQVTDAAGEFLESHLSVDEDEPFARERMLFALAVKPGSSTVAEAVEAIDTDLKDPAPLSLPARVARVRAMLWAGHPHGSRAVSDLLAQTRLRGGARTIAVDAEAARWMSSSLREQCELIDLLQGLSGKIDPRWRRELIAGLGDLQAGGQAAVDTQTGAICLMALRLQPADAVGAQARLTVRHGDATTTLVLAPGDSGRSWDTPITAGAEASLRLMPGISGALPASYRVDLRYAEDARQATRTAIGFALHRQYAVLRDGRWEPVTTQPLSVGDWVRVTMTVDSAAPRHFVAITDDTPGGLMPTDLTLSGVAGLDLARVSDPGSPWFGTRRLDPRAPKFYAEYLPAGRHAVHYFARVGNAGDYLAAPALAELMYGEATRARTDAARLRIEGGPE